MAGSTRRSVVKRLLALPLVGAIAKLNVFAAEDPARGLAGANEPQHPTDLAVYAIRFFNTAQLWYKGEHNHYASVEELLQSDSVKKLKSDKKAEEMGIGTSLIARIVDGNKLSVPGWKTRFVLSSDALAYKIELIDDSGRGLSTLSSDEKGVIYDSTETSSSPSGEANSAAGAISSMSDVGGHQNIMASFTAFVRTLAFGAVPAPQGGCHGKPPCFCAGSCQGGPIPGQCYNCGCLSCVWCCNIF